MDQRSKFGIIQSIDYLRKKYSTASVFKEKAKNETGPEQKNQHPVPGFTYNVYVVELSKRVFTENTKFRSANPQFNGVLECLYVGMTSKTPQERLKQHKTGYRNQKGHKLSANIVQKYGRYLRPSLYNHINTRPMTRLEALVMEEKLAWDLRRQGYAVWFN